MNGDYTARNSDAAEHLMHDDGPRCHYCGPTDAELRPYGPGGSWVCHSCATATPEREAAAQAAYGALLEGTAAISPTGVVLIGEPDGPRPFDPREI